MFSIQTLKHDPIMLRLLLSLIILFIMLVGRRLLSQWAIKGLSHIRFHKIKLEVSAFNTLQKPINFLLLVSGIYFAIMVSPFVYFNNSLEQSVQIGAYSIRLSLIPFGSISTLYFASLAGIGTWIIYELEHLYELFFMDLNEKLSLIDNTVFIRYLSRIINFITIAIGASITLTILVPNLSNIVTGVGIGGVAVAFVSKDSLASIISGMLLLLDKPFVIGDWVSVQDVEGIIEDISFRSTRIRTFTQGLVIMPNNTIGNANIINWSRMEKRRVSFDLGVSYDTSLENLSSCTEEIRKMLLHMDDLESETALVHFTSFGDYSLNIKIVYYTFATQYADYLAVQERVNLEVLKICERNQIEIAFPTQTILLPPSSSTLPS